MQSFNSQFAHPQGVLGRLAGALMAIENRARNRWAISLLQLKPTDRVLEIGFGPGWAIAEMAKDVTKGGVVGVDASETMVAQAQRRNEKAVRFGRVALYHAPATALPLPLESVDKVLSVNSLPFWDNVADGLAEIRRVLKANGRVVITIQPVWAKTDTEVMQVGNELQAKLSEAHFKNVRIETRRAKPLMVSALGEK